MRGYGAGTVVVVLANVVSAQPTGMDTGSDSDQANEEVSTRSRDALVKETRAVTVVGRERLDDLAARTTPEVLQSTPGVSVQKTSHRGGSVFLRGQTGQQTLIMLDGFRLNSAIARSGPNQYLNTVDPWILDRIEVLRGTSSVLYGSDAMGGVVHLHTQKPADTRATASGLARTATVDRSLGGRAAFDARAGATRLAGGVSAQHFGDLRSGGQLPGSEVPEYNGDIQRFTGYEQVSGDFRATLPLEDNNGVVTAAALLFHQLNAPRTDKCQSSPFDCRFFDEQFYDVAYAKFSADYPLVADLDIGVRYARTHQKVTRVRALEQRTETQFDLVHSVGLTGRASTPTLRWKERSAVRISYGLEGYFDALSSEAYDKDLTTGETTPRIRARYLDDSNYLTTAAFGFAEVVLDPRVVFTAGARMNGTHASVAADPQSGTPSFAQTWWEPVVSAGAQIRLGDFGVVANFDQGFRAPNLDDLTARGSEGPGFQLSNPALSSEKSKSFELGAYVHLPDLRASIFGYQSFVDDFIDRELTSCPPTIASCAEADSVFRLVNRDEAEIHGVEAALELGFGTPVRDTHPVGVFANATWTVGSIVRDLGDKVPLSKTPPIHGVVGARFNHSVPWTKVRVARAEFRARWASEQNRLSPADVADRRIPSGGTPGYAVFDISVSLPLSRSALATLRVENITDQVHRVHGSGVDGAGFGIVGMLRGSFSAPDLMQRPAVL